MHAVKLMFKEESVPWRSQIFIWYLFSSSASSLKYILIHPQLIHHATLSSNFFCFHRNWVLSHVLFSCGTFLYHWAPAEVSLPVKKKKKQQQLHPQLPVSNGNFLTPEIYLSHPGSNRMQLCIAVLAVHPGLLLTGRVSPICESISTKLPDCLCGGGGCGWGGGINTPFICNIAETALTCFIHKGNETTVNQNA